MPISLPPLKIFACTLHLPLTTHSLLNLLQLGFASNSLQSPFMWRSLMASTSPNKMIHSLTTPSGLSAVQTQRSYFPPHIFLSLSLWHLRCQLHSSSCSDQNPDVSHEVSHPVHHVQSFNKTKPLLISSAATNLVQVMIISCIDYFSNLRTVLFFQSFSEFSSNSPEVFL